MNEEEIKDGLQAEDSETKETESRPTWRPQDADREYFRYETKKRIQQYSVPPQTVFKHAKPAPTIQDSAHKRVATHPKKAETGV